MAPPVASFRNVRVKAGDATLTGKRVSPNPRPAGVDDSRRRSPCRGSISISCLASRVSVRRHPGSDVGFTLDARTCAPATAGAPVASRPGSPRTARPCRRNPGYRGPRRSQRPRERADRAGRLGTDCRQGDGAASRAAGRSSRHRLGRRRREARAAFPARGRFRPRYRDRSAHRRSPGVELRQTTARGRAAGGGFEGEVATVRRIDAAARCQTSPPEIQGAGSIGPTSPCCGGLRDDHQRDTRGSGRST